MPVAEALKIAVTNRLRDQGIERLSDCTDTDPIFVNDVTPFDIGPGTDRRRICSCDARGSRSPTSRRQSKVLSPGKSEVEGTTHVFAPVANALGKAGMAARDLDAVLFIGGSAINPIVRRAVMDRLPNEVRTLVPKDLQAHVSRGAAIHAFCRGYHNVDVIAPITPEPIFVITRGGGTDMLVRAGTAVPMAEP